MANGYFGFHGGYGYYKGGSVAQVDAHRHTPAYKTKGWNPHTNKSFSLTKNDLRPVIFKALILIYDIIGHMFHMA
jgi:hypothetical protein